MLWRVLSYANNYRVPTVHIHIPYCLTEYFILKQNKFGGSYTSQMQNIMALSLKKRKNPQNLPIN